MKKIFTLIASTFAVCSIIAQSQPCGNSGAAVCSATPNLNYNGFEFYNDLACFEQGKNSEVVVRFKNFNSISIGAGTFSVEYLKIDGFDNLPCGVCWATNKSNNVFAKGESGCIKFTGLTTDDIGQYKILLNARAQTTPGPYNEQQLLTPPGGISAYENEIPNIRLYLRVKASGATTCADADSTQPSKVASSACTGVGINEATSVFSDLQIIPNPLQSAAKIVFQTVESAGIFINIVDVSGKRVYSKFVEAVSGENIIPFERDNLAQGVYFVSLSDGKASATKRFVITE